MPEITFSPEVGPSLPNTAVFFSWHFFLLWILKCTGTGIFSASGPPNPIHTSCRAALRAANFSFSRCRNRPGVSQLIFSSLCAGSPGGMQFFLVSGLLGSGCVAEKPFFPSGRGGFVPSGPQGCSPFFSAFGKRPPEVPQAPQNPNRDCAAFVEWEGDLKM